MTPSAVGMSNVQYRCVIKRVAPYGLHVDIPDLNAKGLLRITELTDPTMVQDQAWIGKEILARILGKEAPDGPFILSQH